VALLRVIEVEGVSPEGWEAAAREAVAQASRTVHRLEHLEVVRCTAVLQESQILEYHLRARLTYRVEDEADVSSAVEAAETILAEPVAAEGEEMPPLLERQIDEALEELDTDVRP
jgi:hypothetical protein